MSCMTRMGLAFVLAMALSSLHRLPLLDATALQIGYGTGYAAVALLWLLTLRQCKPAWPAAMHRAVALLASAGLSLADAFTSGLEGDARQALFFSALLGAAIVQVGARVMMRDQRGV